jgi:HK97 family phage major capsid protein
MNLKALIEKLISEGKSDAEIAALVADYKEGEKSASTDTIVSLILAGRKAADIQASLGAKLSARAAEEAAEAKAVADDAKFEEKLTERLKSIGISPGKYAPQKALKRFNHTTGKVEDVTELTDAYKGFNDFISAVHSKDMASAKSISNEIDRENDRYEAALSGKSTPTVSDVTTRGGFAIPTEVSMFISQLTQAASLVLPYVNKDNVVYNSKIYPVMYGIDVSYITDQSTAIGESNPTFTNPTVNMKRLGAYSAIANQIVYQKGADLVNAFIAAYSSALAKKLDQQITIGNVTGNSDGIDGIVFDALTYLPTAKALVDLTVKDLRNILNYLSEDASSSSTVFLGNRKVVGTIGLLETTGGMPYFPRYIDGGKVAPFGTPLIEIPQIASTLDVGGDARTGGTDDVLICADMSKVMVGLSRETRIDSSQHFQFLNDVMVMRVIKDFGCKVLSGTSTAGIVAVAQELTN